MIWPALLLCWGWAEVAAQQLFNANYDDTIFATKVDPTISLEEFYRDERLALPRPDLATDLFPQLNFHGIHQQLVSVKEFYSKAAANLRKANPMVNVVRLNGGYNVCFGSGRLSEVHAEYQQVRRTLEVVIRALEKVDIKTRITESELEKERELAFGRGYHRDLVHMEVHGVKVVLIDELSTQIECELTSRWPQKTRKVPEIIDN